MCRYYKDVPPYSIVGGVPAKVLKYRYKEEDIQILRNINGGIMISVGLKRIRRGYVV